MTIKQVSEAREGFIDEFANIIRSYRTRITADQIRALNTTPVQIVPAPGADRIVQLDTITAFLDYSGGAFAMGGNNLEIRETNGAGTSLLASADDISAAFMQSVADALVENSADCYYGDEVVRILNAPIVAYVPNADPTGAAATSVLYLTATYKLIKVN